MTKSNEHLASARAELAAGAALRFALNHGNTLLVQGGSDDGALKGITVDLAHELSRRLGVVASFVHYEKAGDVAASAGSDDWDICFLAVDPLRAREIAFTDPYVAIDGNFLAPSSSPAMEPADIDRLRLRLGLTSGSAYSLHLLRESRGATIVEFKGAKDAAAAMLSGEVDALAGVRQAMEAFRAAHAGFRLIDPSFMSIRQAIGIKVGKPRALDYLNAFVAELKGNGFIGDALARSGHGELHIP
jgi:polar amino acid transport system substrate-binding protein